MWLGPSTLSTLDWFKLLRVLIRDMLSGYSVAVTLSLAFLLVDLFNRELFRGDLALKEVL